MNLEAALMCEHLLQDFAVEKWITGSSALVDQK